MIYFTRCSLSDYIFRLSSLGHHQVVSLYRGNYTMHDTIQYVKFIIIIIIIQRDLVFANNSILSFNIQ